MSLIDACGRTINYLRVSVTDRCNLRCIYCLPPPGIELKSAMEILGFEELELIVSVACDLGIDRVRLTGGEPLVRKDIVDLTRKVAAAGVRDLSMTTNAVLLSELAVPLKQAGLDRVNISLDSLRPDRYRRITRCDRFKDVWAGVESAIQVGLHPVKINVVVVRGFNDDEIESFAELALDYPVSVRFIELMPIGVAIPWSRSCRVGGKEVWERLVSWSDGRMKETAVGGNGPAREYTIGPSPGTVGLIAPVSEHICRKCNRLRLSADGRLIPCLAGGGDISLRDILRSDGDRRQLEAAFREAASNKRSGGGFDEQVSSCRMMSSTGG